MNDTVSPSPASTVTVSQPRRGTFNFWRWFWLGTIPVSVVWVWFDFYVPPNHVAWAKDLASAQQQSAQSGKPVILFFTGTWCVPCRIMKRTVWADRDVEAVVRAGFTPVMIDLDDPAAADAVRQYHVGGTPTTIIADPQGKILDRVEGGIGKDIFLGWLGRLKSGGSPPSIPVGS
jgi:protein disulfide-isomerase